MTSSISESNWTTATGAIRIPVRAEIKGIQTQINMTRNIHHIYDYYNFRPFIQGNADDIFQVGILLFTAFTVTVLIYNCIGKLPFTKSEVLLK